MCSLIQAIHIICSIAFHLDVLFFVSTATIAHYLLVFPEFLWGVAAIFFKRFFLVDDPHLIGQKRIKLINAIRPVQIYSVNFVIISILFLFRNLFFSKQYFLFIIDAILILLTFRIILQVYNKEKEVGSVLTYMRQQEFYIIPIIETR
jgi:hypothetical protein